MVDRFCPTCGTEIDVDARFCPTCGRTLDVDEGVAADQADLGLGGGEQPTMAIPPAPGWPPLAPDGDELGDASEAAGEAGGEAREEPPPPPPPDAAPQPSAPEGAAPPPDTAPGAGESSEPDLPFTWPTTLSGWMIGVGSFFGALSLLPRLGNPLDLILFVALLAVSAGIFLADRMPRIDRQRMLTLVVLMVALGVALDRSAFTVRGVHTIFLIAMLIAAGGALLIELDRDRPLPPPSGLR
ncbi:MAG TPA: zinc ribbon domain-containing protein [Methylomirabilota bacterium]